MHYVAKQPTPQFVKDFITGQFIDGKYVNCNFHNLDPKTKRLLKESLLEEQGYICCYTGHQIDFEGSHVEHVKPQSTFPQGVEDIGTLDYDNLLAAYPHSPRGYLDEHGCEYGAQARKNRLVPITPFQADCADRFRYLASGDVESVESSATETYETIQVLALQHPRLQELRKAVIDEAIFRMLEAVSTPGEIQFYLQKLLASISERDDDKRFRAFYFVIKGAASDMLREMGV